jgi:hypothetical protein
MPVRLRRAGVWLIPFVALLVLREVLDVPDELLAMPDNGVPPTRVDGLLNVSTIASLWFGGLGFLARLVWDDSAGLAFVLALIMALSIPFAGITFLLIAFT